MTQTSTSREHHTDLGNAMRLVAQHSEDIRYCGAWKSWLFWDGLRWNEDETGEVERRAKGTARGIYSEAASVGNPDDSKPIFEWARQSESESRIRAMINLAKTEPGIPARVDDLDTDPWLLGVKNGTLNLRTGDVRTACRDDLITKLAPVEYNPAAVCPVWERFLSEIFKDGNQQMVQFLQRAVGYSLTADVSERVLFILHGGGSNGKTTFLETIRDLLGDYAEVTSADTLLVKRPGTIPNDLAALKGARFALASEAEQGRRLAEAQVKLMTGGDTIPARRLYGEWFSFRPTFKIWLATNHKPIIRSDSKAIWDRIRLIPFKVRISDEMQDKGLPRKLREERPGILAWAVRGCLEWQKCGLGVPAEVRDATAGYQSEMDAFGNFLAECCVLEPDAWVTTAALRQTYEEWARENGEQHLLVGSEFAERLRGRGCEPKSHHEGRGWGGIRLAP